MLKKYTGSRCEQSKSKPEGGNMKINFTKLRKNAQMPYRATTGSAGADLAACLCTAETLTLKPGELRTVNTGIAAEIPQGFVGLLFARSSLGKCKVTLANSVGVIDSDYRGEIRMMLINHGHKAYTIKNGDRLVQLIVMPAEIAEFVEVQGEALSDTQRGTGGFGSTN
jgi:dUTP pyrophosphatase